MKFIVFPLYATEKEITPGYNPEYALTSVGDASEYDVYNNVTKFTSAATVAYNQAHGENNVSKTYTYDALGNVLSEKDVLGQNNYYDYYLNGKLKDKIYPDGVIEKYDYDFTGNINITKTDRAGRVTTISNTVFNKPCKIQNPDGTVIKYDYNPLGKILRAVDGNGQEKIYTYDYNGNLTQEKDFISQDSSFKYYKLINYTYNEDDKLITKETFAYNQHTRLLGSDSTTSAGDKVSYAYDKAGRVTIVSGRVLLRNKD